MCRLRLLERGDMDEPVLPGGSITAEFVSTTIEALICDDSSRNDDHDHGDARWWADYELAGQLCKLYQVLH